MSEAGRTAGGTRARGRGRIVVWEGGSLWLLEMGGRFEETDAHSHHAVQISFAVSGRFTLWTDSEAVSAEAVVVAPDALHRFRAEGLIGFLFVEPESRPGRALVADLDGRALAPASRPIPPALVDGLRSTLDAPMSDAELVAIGSGAIAALAGDTEAPPPDPRVREAMLFAETRLDSGISLADAAERFGVSHSRLRHIFAEETGLPFKSWLLWVRLRRAVEAYARGSSLTEAAHEAGFADSAHFSRTFRRTFGAPATALTRLSPCVQARSANRL